MLEELCSVYWDYMIVVSVVCDWVVVCGLVVVIGMELDSIDGLVEEFFGWVIICCIDGGELIEYYVCCIGLVIVWIVENVLVNCC